MDTQLFEDLARDGFISEPSLAEVRRQQTDKHISVHWEITTLLSLGVLLFCSGIGIFVYKNIDSIGHVTIVALIAALMVSGFIYCFKKVLPYSREKVAAPNLMFDYVLLASSLLLITFIGYLQFVFHIFGSQWGLTAFIPVVALFGIAYRFDHLGVLSLAVTNLAAWAGIALSPQQLLSYSYFSHDMVIYSGLLIGILLLGLSAVSLQLNIKPHFAYTYKNFGIHLFFISALAAMFILSSAYLLWLLLLAALAAYQWVQSVRLGTYYFLLVTILYSYVALSYVILRLLSFDGAGEGTLYLGMLYVIISSVGLIRLLVHYNKELHRK